MVFSNPSLVKSPDTACPMNIDSNSYYINNNKWVASNLYGIFFSLDYGVTWNVHLILLNM
jgi:hypothetical protein